MPDHVCKTSDESVVSRVGQVTILAALLGVDTVAVNVLATRAVVVVVVVVVYLTLQKT